MRSFMRFCSWTLLLMVLTGSALAGRSVNVLTYGAKCDGSTNDAVAINAAINAAGSGGEVVFPPATCKATSPILAEDKRGITLRGSSGQYGFNGTRIIGSHTGKAVLSLVGTLNARVDDIILEGDTASRPKNGLLLGRSSAATAGLHTFVNLQVQGFYSVSAVYNVASETNVWINPILHCTACPKSTIYFSQADTDAIGGLTASSMEHNVFYGGQLGNDDTTAGSSVVFIDMGASTGHIHFYGTFLAKSGGDSFIKIRAGAIDGLNSEFPISFVNVFGECSSCPTSGIHFTAGGVYLLAGFYAKNVRFQTPATNNILVDANTVYLIGADISTPWRATGNKPSTFYRCDGCKLSLLTESAITIATLMSSDLTYAVAPTITTSKRNTLRDMSGASFVDGATARTIVQPTYSAAMAVDASLGNEFVITATNGVAFTVNDPTNGEAGQVITITIRNTSGGALGAVTWGAGGYKMSAWTSPATTFSRSVVFRYNGTAWVQTSQTGVDVPN